MIGTTLIESLVQSVALTHHVQGYSRASLLLLAAPESGKTTITTAANCEHVTRIALITGKSVLRELRDHPTTEFLLFNDLSTVRAMSHQAVSLLVTILNQLTQGESGMVAFAGREAEKIDRTIGIIGCMPFTTFKDHRSRWRELGFISRMLPFAYHYKMELVARIKDSIDDGTQQKAKQPRKEMVKVPKTLRVHANTRYTRQIRHLADAKATTLDQLGIRLLANYHVLARGHALLNKRRVVTASDLDFLEAVNAHVSISETKELS